CPSSSHSWWCARMRTGWWMSTSPSNRDASSRWEMTADRTCWLYRSVLLHPWHLTVRPTWELQ
ncbi:unnamed protein product, partial [Closterium sp. NIES-54]